MVVDFLRRHTGRNMLALLIVGSWLTACDDARVYEKNVSFEDRAWKVTEEPRFEFAVSDTIRRYNLYYNVRNSLDYKWARIFVNYHLYDSNGLELTGKLIQHDLFDEKTGKPFGESGIGDLYDHQFLILQNYGFPYRGKYTVKLDQMMRQDTLIGVLAVGVRLEYNQQP
jgi:gliding motility-associated lipoprotein GldH